MKHLNPYRFYELAATLRGLLTSDPQSRVADMLGPLTEAQTALDSLIKGDPLVLEASKVEATRLLGKIGALFDKYFIDPATRQMKTNPGDERLDPHDLTLIGGYIDRFEHAFAAELNQAPTYAAGKLGIYSIHDLIENAQQAFPADVLAWIPEATQAEFKTAGRALAFGLGTAAAVHLLRATELALRPYYEVFAGAPGKAERNYSMYLKKLTALAEDETTSSRPDKRLLQMLTQIKEQYRTPLLTPDTVLSPEQAMSLFGLTSAIITLIAEQRKAHKPKDSDGGPRAATSSPAEKAAAAVKALAEEGEDASFEFRLPQAS